MSWNENHQWQRDACSAHCIHEIHKTCTQVDLWNNHAIKYKYVLVIFGLLLIISAQPFWLDVSSNLDKNIDVWLPVCWISFLFYHFIVNCDSIPFESVQFCLIVCAQSTTHLNLAFTSFSWMNLIQIIINEILMPTFQFNRPWNIWTQEIQYWQIWWGRFEYIFNSYFSQCHQDVFDQNQRTWKRPARWKKTPSRDTPTRDCNIYLLEFRPKL